MRILAAGGELVDADTVVAIVIGVVSGVVGTLGLLDRRRKEITATWKELAEARGSTVAEQDQRIAKLEARLDLFQSGFIRDLAHEVTAAVVEAIGDRT